MPTTTLEISTKRMKTILKLLNIIKKLLSSTLPIHWHSSTLESATCLFKSSKRPQKCSKGHKKLSTLTITISVSQIRSSFVLIWLSMSLKASNGESLALWRQQIRKNLLRSHKSLNHPLTKKIWILRYQKSCLKARSWLNYSVFWRKDSFRLQISSKPCFTSKVFVHLTPNFTQ